MAEVANITDKQLVKVVNMEGKERFVPDAEFRVEKWCECHMDPKSPNEIDRLEYYRRPSGEHGYICSVCGGLVQEG